MADPRIRLQIITEERLPDLIERLRPTFDLMRRHERRTDYANGCRCDACITVAVEDEVAAEGRQA